MTDKMLIYNDTTTGTIVILEAANGILDELLGNYGSHIEDWPPFMRFQDVGQGLAVWEGELAMVDNELRCLSHKIRKPDHIEWKRLINGVVIWP